ncbi:hypothetical protein CesoFtcFv8_000083 [Champsocephalus esox]|uniref:Uncharacterized protein n=1 Tax=Champsocephalus esox TaxID=159716 RepID=A0AAN8HXQ5_9TELE|nr:hypothetical protein CesoFtcFv8_000083 [Champsocephalus esox]
MKGELGLCIKRGINSLWGGGTVGGGGRRRKCQVKNPVPPPAPKRQARSEERWSSIPQPVPRVRTSSGQRKHPIESLPPQSPPPRRYRRPE